MFCTIRTILITAALLAAGSALYGRALSTPFDAVATAMQAGR